MKKLLLFAGFGLAPLWIAIFVVVAGSHASYVSTDYWNTAPWLIVFSLLLCVVTLVIVGIAAASGDMSGPKDASHRCGASPTNVGDIAAPKRNKKAVALLVVVGLIACVAGIPNGNGDRREQDPIANDAGSAYRALQYVLAAPSVAQATGGSKSAHLVSTTQNRFGSSRYRFLFADAHLYAIVDDNGAPNRPDFVVACTTGHLSSAAGGDPDDCAEARKTEAQRNH